jgi:hypothetical protein
MKNGTEEGQTSLSSNRSCADKRRILLVLTADATVAIGLGVVAQAT